MLDVHVMYSKYVRVHIVCAYDVENFYELVLRFSLQLQSLIRMWRQRVAYRKRLQYLRDNVR